MPGRHKTEDESVALFPSRWLVVESGCWIWQGSTSSEGYARWGIQYVHRLAVRRSGREIPEGYQVDHLCRVRSCVNPAHLEVVTRLVNIMRGASRGAVSVRTNRCIRGHEWTAANTYLRPDGGGRQCRACIRLRSRKKAAA